ncbi:hypothetical protein GCM10010232_14550 [Streptomyces amakusaensis]|uniref:Uncharacterized protein n=1 Tax=Streptomyces amakusaensis TaxID=67271 RepID=A0ABW0ABY7_9ACTN
MIDAAGLTGRRLRAVTTSWHHHPESEPSLLHLWLHLDGLGPVRFHGTNDRILLDVDEPHGPYDMGEYGHTTVERDLPGFPVHRFLGRRILSVRAIRHQDGEFDCAVGLALRFPGGDIRVLDLRDDLVVTGEELSTLDPELREGPLTPLHS